MQVKPKIVVLGGGFGGLESLFYLKWKLKDLAEFFLVSQQEHFLFKPNTIYIPFGLSPVKLMFSLEEPCQKKGIHFIQDRVIDIESSKKKIRLQKQELNYDFLVVATGAAMREEEIPGLKEHAYTIWTVPEMLRLQKGIRQLMEDLQKGEKRKVTFLVPPNNKCSGPLYEMVFMLDSFLRKHKRREQVHITWATFEKSFIQAFGPKLHAVAQKEFEQRNIEAHTQWVVAHVEKGQIVSTQNEKLSYDMLISFPPYVAAVSYEGLPHDERGFIQTEFATRQIQGISHAFAVGDTGDFPIKQAFLAFLQADAAAEHLFARLLDKEAAFSFDPVSMCVMEQFDKATFAQVPVKLSQGEFPVEVDSSREHLYRVGSGKIWRLGKKLLGAYLPFRFRAGEPFHAGLPWKMMDAAVRMMSVFFAHQ